MITRRAFLGGSAVLLASPLTFIRPAFARYNWDDPGREPFVGDTTHIRRMGISKSLQDVALDALDHIVIRRYALKRVMEQELGMSTLWATHFAHDRNIFYIVEDLAIKGLPEDVVSAITSRLNIAREFDLPNAKVRIGYLKPGDTFDFMAFGQNKMVRDVEYKPGLGVREKVHAVHRDGVELKAYIIEVSDPATGQGATIVMPTVCRNIALRTRKADLTLIFDEKGEPGSLTPSAAEALRSLRPPWIARSSDPDGCVIQIVVWLWSARSRKTSLPIMQSGLSFDQSRDHGVIYRAAAETGNLMPFNGIYPFSIDISEVRWDRLRGMSYGMNGFERVFPKDFGGFGRTNIPVEIVNGQGVIEMTYKLDDGRGWLMPMSVLEVSSPWGSMSYPEVGALRTCGPYNLANRNPRTSSGGRHCGRARWDEPYWELENEIRKNPCGSVHLHFVK